MAWLPLKLFEPVVAKLPVLLFNEAVYDNILALKAFIEALAAYNDAVAKFNEAVAL